MKYEIEFTDEFELWWNSLHIEDQENVGYGVGLLAEKGPSLGRPHADTLKGSVYPNLKELRVQSRGKPVRILYAFDPRRVALLLLGVTRLATAAGTRSMFAKQNSSTRHISQS